MACFTCVGAAAIHHNVDLRRIVDVCRVCSPCPLQSKRRASGSGRTFGASGSGGPGVPLGSLRPRSSGIPFVPFIDFRSGFSGIPPRNYEVEYGVHTCATVGNGNLCSGFTRNDGTD